LTTPHYFVRKIRKFYDARDYMRRSDGAVLSCINKLEENSPNNRDDITYAFVKSLSVYKER